MPGPNPARPADPLLGYNFVVSLIDSTTALADPSAEAHAAIEAGPAGGFSECSGLEMSLKTEEYREGGNNASVLRFATRVEWGNLTLKRGVGFGSQLWDWHYAFVEGHGRRRAGVIVLLDAARMPAAIWAFDRGLPVKYSGPALNAAQSSVAIESIEIAHEGLRRLPAGDVFGNADAPAGVLV